jgi:hypothetical protein
MRPCLLATLVVALAAATRPSAAEEGVRSPPAALRALVPAGQELLAWRRADLDLDGQADVVFILQRAGSAPFDSDHGDEPRTLVVALGGTHGRLRVVVRNDQLVRCQNCGGTWPEPFEDLSAARGRFSLSHYGGSRWRWSDEWRFVYDRRARDWYLDVMSDGADSEDRGHLVRTYRRGRHFGALRLKDLSSETFLTQGLWPRVPPPPARRAPGRD